MPEPVFDPNERVPTTQLPAELRGVTDPVKVAEYYQRREAQIRQELRPPTPVPPPPTRVTIEQKIDQPPTPISQAETDAARITLAETAKRTAAIGKKYWERFAGDIESLMSKCSIEDRLNHQTWEVAYNTILGMNMEKIRTEETNAAAEASRLSAERSAAPPSQTTPLSPLPYEVTNKILPGLHISEEQYRSAQDAMATGSWPLTAENVSGKRVLIGGEK
jgi:hypothetical protein